MSYIPTKKVEGIEPGGAVEMRLAELGLNLDGLLRVADVAIAEAANATPYHCANAAGTFAYQHGTWALRNEFVGDAWRVDRTSGVESIRQRETKIRVVFSNVDLACDDEHLPKPRSPKGAGAERMCSANLFGILPHYAPAPDEKEAGTFYLMLDEYGGCELSRPIVSEDTFSAYVERIYLRTGEPEDLPDIPDDDPQVFDPQVTRK